MLEFQCRYSQLTGDLLIENARKAPKEDFFCFIQVKLSTKMSEHSTMVALALLNEANGNCRLIHVPCPPAENSHEHKLGSFFVFFTKPRASLAYT